MQSPPENQKPSNEYYVYRHIRLDTLTPFYIGKGKSRRAYNKQSRSKYWKHVVSSVGYRVDIILSNLTEDQAFNKEKEFIGLYKKFNLCECNFTFGGEGVSGYRLSQEQKLKKAKVWLGRKHSKESILKMKEVAKTRTFPKAEKHTEAAKKKISLARKGMKFSKEHVDNMSKALKGRIISIETRKKMSEAHRKNAKLKPPKILKPKKIKIPKPKKNPKGKLVINIVSGVFYDSCEHAAFIYSINPSTLRGYLNGRYTNKTLLRYVE